MITKEAERRLRILVFWEKYGDVPISEAFHLSRATLYRWQKAFRENQKKIEALNKRSTAPKHRRQRIISDAVKEFIVKERDYEKLSKDKLARMMKDDGVALLSASTVGRMLNDLKQCGLLPDPVQYTLNGRTGNMREKPIKTKKKKLRSKGHEGDLVKADTIVRFTNGIKRYIVTAIDLESEFAFAYAYKNHSSSATSDFMEKFKTVAPLSLTHIQTDNGSEFACHFESYCNQEHIVHFHAYPRTPKMQSEVERFNRTLSEAFISRHRWLLAYDIEAFNRKLMDWLIWYNIRRPHWSLGLISPLRYICNKLTPQESHMCWTSTPDLTILLKKHSM
jgi:transposase InsO family protein